MSQVMNGVKMTLAKAHEREHGERLAPATLEPLRDRRESRLVEHQGHDEAEPCPHSIERSQLGDARPGQEEQRRCEGAERHGKAWTSLIEPAPD